MTEVAISTPALVPTPFFPRTGPLCASNKWSRWAGYRTVQTYTTVPMEYFAVRTASSLFDLSPMVKIRIQGRDAARYVDRLIPRRIDKLEPGSVLYTAWCNDNGMVIDDGTIFRLGDDEFRLAAQEHNLYWMQDSALGFDVAIEDVSEQIAALALQGPLSCSVLEAMGLADMAELGPFRFCTVAMDGKALMVSRTGYTGDLGYELWVDSKDAVWLWDRVFEAGRNYGIKPIGSLALDMARIEAGFLAVNTDFVGADAAIRPERCRSLFEVGLGWMAAFDKGHFIGRRALLGEKQSGSSRYNIVVLEIDGKKPAHDAFIYHRSAKRHVGWVTSAVWSPSCKKNIAIATLKRPYDQSTEGLWADLYLRTDTLWQDETISTDDDWARMKQPARIAKPFFNPARRRAVPAMDE